MASRKVSSSSRVTAMANICARARAVCSSSSRSSQVSSRITQALAFTTTSSTWIRRQASERASEQANASQKAKNKKNTCARVFCKSRRAFNFYNIFSGILCHQWLAYNTFTDAEDGTLNKLRPEVFAVGDHSNFLAVTHAKDTIALEGIGLETGTFTFRLQVRDRSNNVSCVEAAACVRAMREQTARPHARLHSRDPRAAARVAEIASKPQRRRQRRA